MARKIRNKFRDGLVDYYKTNRDITREYEKNYEEEKKQEKKPWSYSEKAMIAVTAIAAAGLLIRFLLF